MQKKKFRKHPDRRMARFEVSSDASRTVIRSLLINIAFSLTFIAPVFFPNVIFVYVADHEIDQATLLINWQLGWCVIFGILPSES
jgi:hypothetical protein